MLHHRFETDPLSLMALILIPMLALLAPPASAQLDPIEVAKLLPPEGGPAQPAFGYSVSLSGDTAIVGAEGDDDNGLSSGSAYIYERVGGVWTRTTKLLASDGAPYDYFGHSVSLTGDIAIVGAIGDGDNGFVYGSAYIYERVGGVWTQTAKLLAPDRAPEDRFGASVSLSGNIAIVGARGDDDNGHESGSAYLYEKVGGVWTQTAKLLAPDRAMGELFGISVALSGETAIVGATGYADIGDRSGSAYIFEKVAGVWTQTAKLLASDGAEYDYFGYSVSLSGDTAIVGVLLDDDNGPESGSAYIFEKVAGVWIQTAKLLASDGAMNDRFGVSVSVGGDTAIVGALWDDDNGFDSGSAYIYQKVAGAWTRTAKLLASDGAEYDYFGISVSLSGDTAIVGAFGREGQHSYYSGSAFVYELRLCLNLTVDNLVAGERAVFTITGGTPGTKCATLYGTQIGRTRIENFRRWCATFEMLTSFGKVVGGFDRRFDANGEITFAQTIPRHLSGQRVFFQSAEHGTCPGECMSNLVDAVIE